MSFDKVSYLLEEIIFEPFRSEVAFQIPSVNKLSIVDAFFSIQTRMDSAPKHVGTISPESPENVRIYLNNVDVTPYYIKALADAINALDQGKLAASYASAMDAFIDYADEMGDAYDGMIPELRRDAARLAAVRPLGKLVAKLGDRSHGHKGNLHICNFLYGQIAAPEVSLTQVLTAYNAAHTNAPMRGIDVNRLTFSSGPSVSLDRAAWKASRATPMGAIVLTMALQLHDPLEDEVKRLQDQVMQIQENLTEALDSIVESLGIGGAIRRTISVIEDTSGKSLVEVQAGRRDIQSCEAQVLAQAQTLAHIKTQVDAL